MKIKFTKLIALGLAGVLCAVTFTACGQSTDGPTEPDNIITTQEVETTETSEEETPETTSETSPIETETAPEVVVGQWAVNDAADAVAVGVFDDARTICAEATKNADIEYEPLALIGTQEAETGINYKVLCYAKSPDRAKLIYLTINDDADGDEKATIVEREELDLEEMESTVNSMGTPRNADSGYTVFDNGIRSDLGELKDLFVEYTSASAATCSYTPKAILGSKELEDGTTDYAILCTRTLSNKTKGDKTDYGIAFLHVGATRGDTYMKQVHLLDLSKF